MFTRTVFYTLLSLTFGKTESSLPKYRKIGESTNTPQEMVHINGERLSYASGDKVTKSDSTVNVVHYNTTAKRLQ